MNLLDFNGFIDDVTRLLTSSQNKPCNDVTLKTCEADSVTIRIMKKSNPNTHRQEFVDALKAGKPVTFSKLNKGARGCYFFNSYRGSSMETCEVQLNFKPTDVKMTRVIDMKDRSSGSFLVVGHIMWSTPSYMSPNGKMIRDGIFKDGSGILPITVWGDTIKEIIDNETCFKLTNVALKNYYGNKLSTMPNTKVTAVKSDTPISWSNVDAAQFIDRENLEKAKLISTLCCPEIIAADLQIYPVCTNKLCSKKVMAVPGEPLSTCESCGKTMMISKCKCGFNCNIDVQPVTGDAIALTIFADTMAIFLKQDDFVTKYGRKQKSY